MPYFEPWDINTPSDAEARSQGDDRIRELKRSIEERLERFFEDFNSDPLIPKAKIIKREWLADSLIQALQLDALAVTEPKIADDAVSSRTIADNAIQPAHIPDASIPASKLTGVINPHALEVRRVLFPMPGDPIAAGAVVVYTVTGFADVIGVTFDNMPAVYSPTQDDATFKKLVVTVSAHGSSAGAKSVKLSFFNPTAASITPTAINVVVAVLVGT